MAVYTCQVCGRTFATNVELQTHIAVVHPSAPPRAGFTDLYVTYRGVQVWYNPTAIRWWCEPKANYSAYSTSLATAKSFIDGVLGAAPAPVVYTCPTCGATFSTEEGLKAHIIVTHPTPVYTCPTCGATFDTQALLTAHIASAHPTPAPSVPAGYTTLTEMYRDIQVWYNPDYIRWWCQPKAGYSAYSTTLAKAEAYIDAVLGPAVGAYKCSICGATFGTPDLLGTHMALAHPTPPPPPPLVFTCPTCGATFTTQALLDAHIAVVHPATSWPWPLSLVQPWFDNLWNNVISAPVNAFNTFWTTYIVPKLDWVKDRVMEGIDWIYHQLEPTISGVNTSIIRMRALLDDTFFPMINDTITSVGNMREDLIRILNEAIANTTNTAGNIQKYLGTAVNDIIDALTITSGANIVWIWSQNKDAFNTQNLAITTGLGSVLTLMDESRNATHGDIDNSTTFLGGAINLGFSGALNTIGSWLDGVLKGVAGAFGTGLSGFFDGVLKSLGWIAEMIFGAIGFVRAKLKELITPILTGFLDAMTGGMSSHSPPEEIKIASNVFAQTMWNKQMAIIDKAYHSEPTGQEIMESGISLTSDLIAAALGVVGLGLIVDVVHPLKALGFKTTTRELVYWSGIPSITAALAVTPTAIGILRPLQYFFNDRYKNMIPPVDDVIRFSLREVWIPERRPLLLQFYPPEPYQGLIAKQGYSQEFAEDYWAAHWVLPSIGQLNEMLYRGIITPEKWETEVRYNDLVPYSIPWLKKIIYSPYTRVDIRRMWDIGLVTDPELLENYKWLGYDDAHAQRMTLWTKAYIIAGDVRALYSKGWINEAGARQMLIDVGVPKERVDVFMMRVVKSGQAERMTAEKDLTKTDILRLFKLNLMSVNEAMGMLQDLGYDEEEANYLIKIQEYAPQLEMKELTMSQILKAYSNEVYLRDEAKGLLMEAGWTETAAETLLKLEDIKLKDAQTVKMMEKELTRTDIVKGIDKGIIDKDTGAGYLSYLGYSQWEINFIFALEEIA